MAFSWRHSDKAALSLKVLAVIAVAGGMIFPIISVNMDQACVVNDTPYLPICPRGAHRPADLRARLSTSPGDTPAYIELAILEPGASTLAAAVRLAPTNPKVQLLKAADALQRGQVRQAIRPLVELTEYHDGAAGPAALARLVVSGQTAELEPFLEPGKVWPARVLVQMNNAGGSMASALPLVSKALAAKALDPAAVSSYIKQLKAAHSWADGYALWLTLHGRALPLLYNGSFDQPFLDDGFDWEVPRQLSAGREGAVVDRTGAEERGAILDIRFTGRAISVPMIQQFVFTGAGRYQMKGDYRTREMHLEQGLSWFVRCASDTKAVAGQSEALLDTSGAWQQFKFDFVVPPTCGPVAVVQLEPTAKAEATAGGRGRAAFDALSIERILN